MAKTEQFLSVQTDWVQDFVSAPVVTMENALGYLSKSRDTAATRQMDKGWNMKEERYVGDISINYLQPSSTQVFFKGACLPSMKKGLYKVFVAVHKNNGKVTEAFCDCVAGLSESCSHVAALLFTLVDLFQGITRPACTDVLCQWIVPPKAKKQAPPMPLKDITFKKHVINKPARKVSTRRSHVPFLEKVSSTGQKELIEDLRKARPEITWLRYAAPDDDDCTSSQATVSNEMRYSISQEENLLSKASRAHVSEFMNKIKPISNEEQSTIERETLGQAKNPKWFTYRVGKITASIFGEVINCRKPDYIIKKVLYPSKASKCEAIAYGRLNEDLAVGLYQQLLECGYDKRVQIVETGIFVCKDYPFLAASPDRIVQDGNDRGLLEVKCPEEACSNKSFYCTFEDGQLVLKRNHKYYYQVQGQMGVCGYQWCDFVVWTNNGDVFKSLSFERIIFDEDLWVSLILPSVLHFYKFAIVPEILSGRVKYKGHLYEHPEQYISYKNCKEGFYACEIIENMRMKIVKLA